QARRRAPAAPPASALKTSEELQLEKEPIRVRETGFWLFKQIIVPPNVYVVHTRIGRKEPVTIGLGLSFRYNPYTDAYLVVPAAMQTIGIVANSISREKQGINVLAYVQWQIHDFAVAYRKLDFSDTRDPLGIVNAQLREQAEAAIKDKIATMSVEEVLTDKAPIIEELTARLKAVAEGRGQGGDEGLGIKIVTVQIKEALVSSQRLWEHLQAPFRYEQEKAARISFLQAQDEIRVRELENRRLAETSEAETMVEIARTTQTKQTEALEIRLAQEGARFTREQEMARQKLQLELQTALARQEADQRLQVEAARIAQEAALAELRRAQEAALERARLDAEAGARRKVLEVERALQELAEETRLAQSRLEAEQGRIARETALRQLEAELQLLVQAQQDELRARQQEAELARARQEALARLELEEATNRARVALAREEAELERLRQEVRNQIGERDLASRLVERLPELAAHMPEIHELKVLQTGPGDGTFDALAQFLARMVALAEGLGISLTPKKAT
ncbi:MAG TPA: SPFH domain-containing protein, partial [Roseiflexaceae bacterium]|nr:SPFH domain-containing protein [Roseiflexaceae bacterium]